MPLTVWIAGGIAIAGAIVMVTALWFDRLFEAPAAVHAASLVQHLGSQSVLAVFAHPDDETWAAGVLADAASREGVAVRTISLTRGERGHPDPPILRIEDVPLVRESELRRFGFALGIDHQELWEYPDGELAGVPVRVVIDRVVRQIRTWRPDLVLTFDPAGGYTGHADHRAAGTITTEAVRGALDPAYKPELGSAYCPKHVGYLVAPARAFLRIGGPALRAVAAAQPHANMTVSVEPQLRILGWETHASQHLEKAYPLPGWLLFDFWDKEHYAVFESGVVASTEQTKRRNESD